MTQGRPYVGRFAPSPTGRLHLGSMVAAVASYLDARAHGGTWLVRMEDLDPPREVAGAADDILRTLEGYGLHWDGAVLFQHTRHEAYREALQGLMEAGKAFGCTNKNLLVKVEIPAAMSSIRAGVTQCIMLSLSMVVIAAYVGADGLGKPVVQALGRNDPGWGFESGCGICAVAIMLDRMLRVKRK